MCDYCDFRIETHKALIFTDKIPFELDMKRKRPLTVDVVQDAIVLGKLRENGEEQTIAYEHIKFCPMCGRKL